MAFTEEQKRLLDAPLDGKVVKKRSQGGMNLSYIEGWWAIKEANRIFGHGNWDRATVHMECVWSGERQTRNGPKPAASYVARVRILVRGENGETVIREGTGTGSGFGNDAGEAHESASKEAETDAMKRALMTFGNPFGLALYDKDQTEVDKGGPTEKQTGTGWIGPLPRTKLTEELRRIRRDLMACEDYDSAIAMFQQSANKAVIEQAKKDMKEEFYGPVQDGESWNDVYRKMLKARKDAEEEPPVPTTAAG